MQLLAEERSIEYRVIQMGLIDFYRVLHVFNLDLDRSLPWGKLCPRRRFKQKTWIRSQTQMTNGSWRKYVDDLQSESAESQSPIFDQLTKGPLACYTTSQGTSRSVWNKNRKLFLKRDNFQTRFLSTFTWEIHVVGGRFHDSRCSPLDSISSEAPLVASN